MIKRGARRVFLGVQWDTDSWDNLSSLCAVLLERVGPLPLHWNFPALPPDSMKKTRPWLEKAVGARVESGADAALPMGFAGACHPFLNLDELDRELTWAVKNPWGTGIADVLGKRPSVLVPRLPDAFRPAAVKLYADHGFTTLGVCRSGPHSWFGLDGLACFTYSRLPVHDTPAGQAARIRELAGRRGDLFLMLDVTAASAEELRAALDAVSTQLTSSGRGDVALLGAPPADLPSERPSAGLVDWSAFPDPILRKKLGAVAGLSRRKRKRNDDYRELLSTLSPVRGVEERETPPIPSHVGTRLVAQMLGEVVLAGNVFDVKLDGGRFHGIVRAGRDLLPPRAALSYLRVQGKTWHFQTRNSFSFEGDGGTGLREELAIDSRDGSSLAIEYSFRDDCPLLEIRAEVRWPVIEGGVTVDEHAPFVMSLLDLGRAEDPVIETSAPNEAVSTTRIGDAAWRVVPGAEHRVSLRGGGAIILRSVAESGRAWNAPSFRIAGEGRRRTLLVNPFGGWAAVPSAALSGKSETFALLVGLDDGSLGRPGATPQERERR
ncbi:MAG TPA: hypothetical protein VMV03_01110 [Spirochaetia bacterium]|nr:hypothetical protein [Spirochaetia bacterium]